MLITFVNASAKQTPINSFSNRQRALSKVKFRPMADGIKHGVSAYAHGLCRCSVCRAASTAAKARQRANRAAKPRTPLSESLRPASKPATPKVVALPSITRQVEASMGENEAGVRQQCANSRLSGDRPGTVAQCITLSKILDNPDLAAMWPTTSRQLQSLLATLDGPRKKMKASHLSTISAMAGRKERAI